MRYDVVTRTKVAPSCKGLRTACSGNDDLEVNMINSSGVDSDILGRHDLSTRNGDYEEEEGDKEK